MRKRYTRCQPPLAVSAIGLAMMSLCGSAAAQQTDRIEITGSIIKRAADEGALPVTSVRAEELEARGHTELKDYMLELPQASSLGTFGGTAGPMTNLRGFGPMRTLTLLNGRRLAKEPLTNQYVSVNVMPRMAQDRIDILRDGASSAYGSDAISGVQAFYTKRSYKGVGLKAELLEPERSGGGASKSFGLIGGVGDLATAGWNVYGAVELRDQKVLLREARPELIDGSALNQLGISTAPALGGSATPANFTDPTHPTASQRTLRHNPYFASGCLPPYSEPSTASGRQTCFLDANDTYSAFTNGSRITNVYARGTLNLNADHSLGFEYNLGNYVVDQYNPATTVTVRLNSSHPYYPGNASGKVPAVAGVNTGGRPIDAMWSIADLGPRVREDRHSNQRFVLSAEGRLGAWDYRAGLNHGRSERDTRTGEQGWATITGLATVQGTATTLFLDPKLNPFGLQTAEGLALLKSSQLIGRTLRLHKAENSSIDATASRELMNLAGGPMLLALGAEFRRDLWHAVGLEQNRRLTTLNGLVDLIGGDGQANGAGPETENKISRDISSVYAELDMPVLKTLTLNASLRADQYKDLRETTLNPKLSFRYEPMPTLVLRGSANTGFRAPALPEIYSKETELTAMGTFDDPLYCNSTTDLPNAAGTAAGLNAAQVCNLTGRSQITKVPNNAGVTPEKSKSFTLGAAFEPLRGMTMSLDYWQTQIDNVIGNRSITFILANPTLYPDLYLRNSDRTLATSAVFNPVANLGSVRGAGVDVSLKYSSPKSAIGSFTGGLDVAYLTRWEARSPEVNGGAWLSALANYNDVVPVNPNAGLSNATRGLNHRWRHTASIGWNFGDFKTQLSQRYQSKVRDQNSAARTGAGTTGPRDVASYEQYNLTTSYAGIKNLKLSLAVSNLFDVAPPLTNHTGYAGYLTSSVDVLGRAYRVTAEYKF